MIGDCRLVIGSRLDRRVMTPRFQSTIKNQQSSTNQQSEIRKSTIHHRVSHWRPPQPVLRRLLERMRELQHAPFTAVPADDLNSNRKAGAGEPGRNRDGRIAHEAYVPARAHPVQIVAHASAGDLGRIWSGDIERRDLRHRQYKVPGTFSKNCRLCSCACACRARARPIWAPVSRSASATSNLIVSFTHSGRSRTSGAYCG